jgi:PAS domain S-box-containing protein
MRRGRERPKDRYKPAIAPLPEPDHSPFRGYGLALGLAVLVIAAESAALSIFGEALFLIAYPCVFLISWLAGLGPALVFIILSGAGLFWMFVESPGAPLPLNDATLLFFALFYAFSFFAAWLITRGQKTALALRDSERRLRIFEAFIENSSDFIGIADPEGRPVYVNPAGRSMVELPPEQPIEETRIQQYYPKDLRTFAVDVIVKSMMERGIWRGETFLRNWRTEEPIPVSDEHFMIRDPETGRVLGMGTMIRDISQQRRIEEALRQSESDLRQAQSVAKVGSWWIDLRSDELTCSEESYRMFGLPVGTPMSYPGFLTRVHPDDRDFVDRSWKAALAGQPYEIEYRILVREETKWILAKAEIEFERAGRAIRGTGTVQDVTERRRTEIELRRRRGEERFRLALDSTSFAVVVVDQRGLIDFVNGEVERVFGWTREELLGRPLEILIPERFRSRHVRFRSRFFRDLEKSRQMVGRELVAIRKDGSEFPVEIGLSRFEEDGKPFVVASVADVSLRRAAETALRESEQSFRLLVQSSREYAIFMQDTSGRITVWNEGAERILGYRADEVLGMPFDRFFPPEESAAGLPRRELRKALEKGSYEIEDWRVRKDGTKFWANVVITPIYGPDGEHIGFGKVIRDLTEKRMADQELRVSAERLRRSVAELESFAHTISHDLRAPLRAIEGYSYLLSQKLSGVADAECRMMLNRMSEAGARLDLLIRDLLSYNAIAQQEVRLEEVDLDQILAHVIAHYPDLKRARLRVRSPLGRALAQPSLMIQVLSNLLGNAVKFMPAGRTPEIEVRTERRGEGRVVLQVRDNGIGIPPEAWDRVFLPFVRLQPAGKYEGTGIGLPIVKRAVERMGGSVWVESEAGEGCLFSVELREV